MIILWIKWDLIAPPRPACFPTPILNPILIRRNMETEVQATGCFSGIPEE